MLEQKLSGVEQVVTVCQSSGSRHLGEQAPRGASASSLCSANGAFYTSLGRKAQVCVAIRFEG